MERALLLAGQGPILPEHCPPERNEDVTIPLVRASPPTNGSLWEMERELIFKTLARVKDNRTHAAKELASASARSVTNYGGYREGEHSASSMPGGVTTIADGQNCPRQSLCATEF